MSLLNHYLNLIKKHKTIRLNKKIDRLCGEVYLADFKKKYSGDNTKLMLKIRDSDADAFIDMCKEEGIAVVKIHNFDGNCYFLVAESTSQLIKDNIEKLSLNVTDLSKLEDDIEFELKSPTISKEYFTNSEEMADMAYDMSASREAAEEKQANFKEHTEKFTSSEILASADFTDKEQAYNFITNALNDERMMLCESNDYESFPLHENMIVKEDSKSLSIALNGKQYDIDKSLVFFKNGYIKAYVPRNSENAVLGKVTCGGRNIDAKTLNRAVREKRNINVTDAVKDINVLKSGRSK